MVLDVTLVSLDWMFVILEASGLQITSAPWTLALGRRFLSGQKSSFFLTWLWVKKKTLGDHR